MKSILFTLTFTAACFCTAFSQAPGTFDNTFGTNGIVITNLLPAPASPSGISDDEATAVAIQPDGKIVVAGVCDDWTATNYDFAICRYNTDGTLDNTFSGDGKEKIAPVANNNESVRGVAIQSDGKIVVLGYISSQFILVRFNSNGTIDNTFGTAGIVTTQVSPNAQQANALKIQPDGKILAAGYGNFNGNGDFVIVRYNTNGTLDNSFGTAGIAVTPIGNASESINALELQPDGKILAAGITANTGSNIRYAIARYNTNGTLDATFGTAGTATAAPTNSTNIASSIRLQPDGKIIVGGRSLNPVAFDFSMARFNANGTLDNTFGTNGTVVHSIGTSDEIHTILLQSSGKIIACGTAMISNNRNFTLARYTTAGVLDNTFGTAGVVTNSLGPCMAGIAEAAFQADGKLVGVGTLVNNLNSIDFTVVRYNMECAAPSAPATIAGNATICPGFRTYSVAPVSGATSYSWSLPGGWTGTSTSNSITANATTSGTLQVASVNACNASPSTSLAVKVNNCTGIHETASFLSQLDVYPNPANSSVTIDTKQSDGFNYSITNVTGMQVSAGEFTEATQLDLAQLPKGHYLITIKSKENGFTTTRHLVLTD